MDLYVILGLEQGATESEIKRAYRRLARRFHPDINPGDRMAEAQFRQILEAYETLMDPGLISLREARITPPPSAICSRRSSHHEGNSLRPPSAAPTSIRLFSCRSRTHSTACSARSR